MGLLTRYRQLDRSGRRFVWAFAGLILAGWLWRLFFILNWKIDLPLGGDALIYHRAANLLAEGKGFVDPIFSIGGHPRQAANSPPLYLVWLAIPSVLGFTTAGTHILWTSVLGAAAILVVGLTGLEIGGRRVALIAAAVTVADPMIFYWNATILTESMALLTASLVLLLAYRYWRVPSWRRVAWLGLAVGLASLSRAELILLFPFVVLPLVLTTRAVARALRWKWLGAAALALIIPVAPWVTYNMFRFEHPVTLSAGFEITIAASNCDETYHGVFLGYWSFGCVAQTRRELGRRSGPFPQESTRYDQSEEAVIWRKDALDYIGNHLDRLPVVVLARWGRITEVWRVHDTYQLAQFPEGMERWVAGAVVYDLYPMVALAILGLIVLRRRRTPVFPLLATPLTVLIVTTLTFANLRYRTTAEPSIVILGAVAIDALIRRFSRPAVPAVDAGRPPDPLPAPEVATPA